ncbi:MAG: alkaline phosphatase, partial [Geminicoccaceae bacterium]
AIAVIDVEKARVSRILPLGLKDHSQPGAGLDTSRRDGDPPSAFPSPTPSGINIEPRPVFGAYQPDGIAAFADRDGTYLVTANEGDARNGDFDIAQLADLAAGKDSNGVQFTPIPLDPTTFPDAAVLLDKAELGELEISDLPQDLDPDHVGDGAAHRLVALGGRSFSIWDSQGRRVFDSGDRFERLTARLTPALFNTQDDDNQFDRRSPKRGPEPEGVAVGEAYGRTYAFVGLERHSGIMVYDVTDPRSASFAGYFNTRDFAQDPNQGPSGELANDAINCAAGDLGPEGMLFISAWYSPSFRPLLVVNYETSGSTRIWEIRRRQP